MIHYHGGPITPVTAAFRLWRGRHAFVSFAHPEQVDIALEESQSFALDNGAFSMWKSGASIDWDSYYAWVGRFLQHPGFDFALIPDVIDGSTSDNAELVDAWPFSRRYGVPVWHLHESVEWLEHLVREWPRVAIGSSGEFASIGSQSWWNRMAQAMRVACDSNGMPLCKLHGLRMLNPEIFSRFPFSSADSTNVAQNIGIDGKWRGTYSPASKETRALVIAERVEQTNSSQFWQGTSQPCMFSKGQ